MANSLMNFIPDLHLGPAELRGCLTGNIIIKENVIGTTNLWQKLCFPPSMPVFIIFILASSQYPHENG